MGRKVPDSLKKVLQNKNSTTVGERKYTAEEVYKMPKSLRSRLEIDFNDEEYEAFLSKQEAAKTIDFDTINDDLTVMSDTIKGIYKGWQDNNTMSTTKESVENMYNRLVAYEDYRKTYGNEEMPDITELVGEYKNLLDEWDSIAEIYSRFNNAEEYLAAVEEYKASNSDSESAGDSQGMKYIDPNTETIYIPTDISFAFGNDNALETKVVQKDEKFKKMYSQDGKYPVSREGKVVRVTADELSEDERNQVSKFYHLPGEQTISANSSEKNGRTINRFAEVPEGKRPWNIYPSDDGLYPVVEDGKITRVPLAALSDEEIEEYTIPTSKVVAHSAGYLGEKLIGGTLDAIEDTADFLVSIPMTAVSEIASDFGEGGKKLSGWLDNEIDTLNRSDLINYWNTDGEENYKLVPEGVKNWGWLPENVGRIVPTIVETIYTGGGNLVDDAVMYADDLSKAGNWFTNAVKRVIYSPETHFGMSAAGSSTEDALNKGVTPSVAVKYGAAAGAIEVLTEKLFGGFAGTDIGDSLIDFKVASPMIRKILNIATEAVEEDIVAFADPALQRAIGVDKNAEWATWADYKESGSHGMILSLVMNIATAPFNVNTRSRHIKEINKATKAMNEVITSDEYQIPMLSDLATDEEIQKRKEELQAVAVAYNEFVERNVQKEKQENVSFVGVNGISSKNAKSFGTITRNKNGVELLINSGFSSANEVTRNLATDIQKKISAGEKVSDIDIGRLFASAYADVGSGKITASDDFTRMMKSVENAASVFKSKNQLYVTSTDGNERLVTGKRMGEKGDLDLYSVDASEFGESEGIYLIDKNSGLVFAKGKTLDEAQKVATAQSERMGKSGDASGKEFLSAVEFSSDALTKTEQAERAAFGIRLSEKRKKTSRLQSGSLGGKNKTVGRLVHSTDFENTVMDMAKESDDAEVRGLLKSLTGDLSAERYFNILGKLAKKQGIRGDQLCQSLAASFRDRYENGLEGDYESFNDYLNEEIKARKKAGDELSVQALELLLAKDRSAYESELRESRREKKNAAAPMEEGKAKESEKNNAPESDEESGAEEDESFEDFDFGGEVPAEGVDSEQNKASNNVKMKSALSGNNAREYGFSEDKYFARQIDKWDSLNETSYITVGKIGGKSALAGVGLPAGKLYFDVKKLKSELDIHSDHLTEDILKGIPDLLNNPIAITEFVSEKNTVSVYGELYANGKLVVVGIVVTGGRGGNVISKIRTVHARSDIKNQITDKSILYLRKNKKEVNAWFQAIGGINVPLGGTQLGVIRSINLSDSIAQKNALVNSNNMQESEKNSGEDNSSLLANDASGDERLGYSEQNKNMAVENFAVRLNRGFKSENKKITVEVYYDSSQNAKRGEWSVKDGKTVIRLNGTLLRGAQSASWVMTHELFHEGAKNYPQLTALTLDAFSACGLYDGSQFDSYKYAYEENRKRGLMARLKNKKITKEEYQKELENEYSREYIEEEIAADLMYRVVGSSELSQMFAEKADKKLLSKHSEFLRAFSERMSSVFDKNRAVRYSESANTLAGIFERAINGEFGQENNLSINSRVRNAIGITADNKRFVVIDRDILNGIAQSDWRKVVSKNLASKFPNGITLGSNQVNINQASRRELTYSEYTKWLAKNEPQIFSDKLRATDNADEILKVTSEWMSEGLNHPRNDNIKDFARGHVLLKVGNNDYSAEVIVGTKSNGQMLLYDIVNLSPTVIKVKKSVTSIATESLKETSNRSLATDNDSISQKNKSVNTYSMQNEENDASESKSALSGKQSYDAQNGENISDADFEEVLSWIEAKYSKDSAEYTLAKKITELERERKDTASRLNKTGKAYRIKAFEVDEAKISEFAQRLSEKLGFEKHMPKVASVKDILESFYKEMEGFISGKASQEDVAERARGAAKEILDIREDIKKNCGVLVTMDAVAELQGNELDGDLPLREKIKKLFESFGNNIHTNRFGDVALTNSSIRSELRHGSTKDKITAYAAIPQVLQNGVVIDKIEKNFGEVERIVVAAPIKISGTDYIMGVMLQRDKTSQRLYIHDVIIRKEASDYQPEHLITTGPLDNENLFITEVLEKAVSVGYSIAQNKEVVKENYKIHKNAEAISENLAAKLISSYLQIGKIKAKMALPSLETLISKKFSCEDELAKISESIPEESSEELRLEGQRLQGELRELDGELVEQKKKTPYARILEGYDKVYSELSAREQAARQELSDYKLERREREQRERLFRVIKGLTNAKTDSETRKLIKELYGKYDTVGVNISEDGFLNLSDLKEEYEKNKRSDPDFIADRKTEKELERLDKVQIGTLPADEVVELLNQALALSHGIKNQNFIYQKGERRKRQNIAQEAVSAINQSGGVKFENSIRRYIEKYDLSMLSPARFFKKILGYDTDSEFYRVCDDLNAGERRSMSLRQEFSRPFEKLVSSKNKQEDKRLKKQLNDFTGKNAIEYDTGIISKNGKRIFITPAMKVSLYLQRKNSDFLRHACYGGITFPDIKLFKKGKLQEAYAKGELVVLTPTEIESITSGLTEYEKAWADATEFFFNEASPKYINEAYEQLYGYEIANIENYFPINTNKNYNKTEFESLIRDATLEGMGFLKERIQSTVPVNLEDVTDVLNRHMSDVAAFSGLAVPIRSFQSIFNTVSYSHNLSVKGAIERMWGPEAIQYIEKLITDFQSPRKNDSGVFKHIENLRSLRAASIMAVNIPVTLGNLAAFPQAAGILGWDAINAASVNGQKIKFDEDIVAKYTPYYNERRAGYTVRELGDIRNKQDVIHRTGILEKSFGMMQGVDLLVTRRIWIAAEYYVRKSLPELSVGSDEYYRAVADIFNKALEETQPMYSTYQRPEMLRSTNFITRELTMFKSALMQNYNVMYDACFEYRAMKKSGNTTKIRESKKKLQRVISSQIVAGLVVATMNLSKIILTAGAAYRDDDDELTLQSVAMGFGKDFVSNFTSMLPGFDDTVALGASVIESFGIDIPGNSDWFDLNVSCFEMINTFGNRVKNVITTAKKYGAGEVGGKSVGNSVYKLSECLSQMLGIPLSNTVGAVWNAILFGSETLYGENYGRYMRLKMSEDGYKTSTLNDMYKIAAEAYVAGGYNKDDKTYAAIKQDIIASGFTTEAKFKKKVQDYIKKIKLEADVKAFKAGELYGKDISREVVEEVYGDRIDRAARLVYLRGDEEGARNIIAKIAKETGRTEGQIASLVKEKKSNYQ